MRQLLKKSPLNLTLARALSACFRHNGRKSVLTLPDVDCALVGGNMLVIRERGFCRSLNALGESMEFNFSHDRSGSAFHQDEEELLNIAQFGDEKSSPSGVVMTDQAILRDLDGLLNPAGSSGQSLCGCSSCACSSCGCLSGPDSTRFDSASEGDFGDQRISSGQLREAVHTFSKLEKFMQNSEPLGNHREPLSQLFRELFSSDS